MSRRIGCTGCFTLLAALTAAGGAALYVSLGQPYQSFSEPVIVEFPKGTPTGAMGTDLASAGVIRGRWQWMLARALRPAARLQAGEYKFSRAASVWTVYDRIARGDVFYYEITVPEGTNLFDIAQLVERTGLVKGADFLKVARSAALIQDLAPNAPSLEGYLFPSTYRFTRSITAPLLAKMMTDLFRKRWRELDSSAPVNDTVTLASLVEKETAVPAERSLVASVYRNRLRNGVALDCDPTTIYAALLEERYRGTIYKSDLSSTNAYNTYRHPGLPPGPIASPGLASLKAALAPAETDYIYFVAKPDGSGGHNFSATLAEHNRAVAEYRSAQKSAGH
jgi:UPF0755 protein